MKIKNKEKIATGYVKATLYDSEGNVKQVYEGKNTITNLMDAEVAEVLTADGTIFAYAHAGTGTGQDAADTNLATYCAELRTATTSVTQGAGGDDNDIIVVFTLGAGVCTATLTEMGLFMAQAQATADMMAYKDSFTFTKAAGDSLVVTWTFTFGAS